jgi:hypothetical protein
MQIGDRVYKPQGPYCDLCGNNMGKYYNHTDGFINPHNYESYSDNICPVCGAKYHYYEGNLLELTRQEMDLIRKHRGITKEEN